MCPSAASFHFLTSNIGARAPFPPPQATQSVARNGNNDNLCFPRLEVPGPRQEALFALSWLKCTTVPDSPQRWAL